MVPGLLAVSPNELFLPLFWTSLTLSSISGEIDIMEARGNGPAYSQQ
jgi:hypothetical protein